MPHFLWLAFAGMVACGPRPHVTPPPTYSPAETSPQPGDPVRSKSLPPEPPSAEPVPTASRREKAPSRDAVELEAPYNWNLDLKKATFKLPPDLPYDARFPPMPGYHVELRPQYGRVILGASLLAAGYALTVAFTFAVSDQDGNASDAPIPNPGYSLIPLAGPFIEGVDALTPVGWGIFFAVAYLPLAALQVTGTAFLIAGPVTKQRQVWDGHRDESKGPVLRFTANGLALQF